MIRCTLRVLIGAPVAYCLFDVFHTYPLLIPTRGKKSEENTVEMTKPEYGYQFIYILLLLYGNNKMFKLVENQKVIEATII